MEQCEIIPDKDGNNPVFWSDNIHLNILGESSEYDLYIHLKVPVNEKAARSAYINP